ncbi:MAG TPA: thiamine pyrophosphate-dependent dehydrogenase E1 component subunit alpha [Steroidobacteraceae bacterium]|jgi:pyruvate dehydrogenase E1 component alpha subunit
MTDQPIADRATRLDILRRMALLKLNDESTRKIIRSGRLQFPYYSYRGQEAIPAAVSVNLTDQDYICTIYRGIHDMLAKGMPLNDLWAEVAGRVTGTCKGKGGPMHLTYPRKGIMVTTGIVGSSMPIANGIAWGSLLAKDGRVTVAYFGDGASNIGAFHEALNLAAIWKLPVVFVCQNNRYGEHTAYEKTTSIKRIADRAAAYEMPGVNVDGNDPVAMFGAAKTAIDRARAGAGPTLIEAVTFRFEGHVFGDSDNYMAPELKQRAIANDPYPRYRSLLITQGDTTEAEISGIEQGLQVQIDAAIEHALGSEYPALGELQLDVYSQELPA